MSVECLAWAFRQKIPAKPKIVLLALADQADEASGHVCYGRRNMKYIARKATCGERTLYRYIAALVRNGYVICESGKGKGKENEYYLQLDRNGDASGEWTWRADDPEAAEAQDVASTDRIGSAEKAEAADIKNGAPGVPHRVAEYKNLESTKEHRPADEKPVKGFSRQTQDLERSNAARAFASQKLDDGEFPGQTFVIEGTRWWAAFEAYRRSIGRPINQTMHGIGKYRGKTGRYVKNELLEQILKSPSTAPPSRLTDGVDEGAAKEFADCNR